MRAREGRPLLLVDLAVPRDIDDSCARLDGVTLFDIDDLQAIAARNRKVRQAEARHAEGIIEEEIGKFATWLGSLEVLPTLAALRARAADIAGQVVGENRGKWESASPRDLERIDAVARAVVNRLLHEPTLQMKTMHDDRMHARMALVRDLFGLTVEEGVARRRRARTPPWREADSEPAEADRRGRGSDPRALRPRMQARGQTAPPPTPLMRIGTRGSALALIQAGWVAERLGAGAEVVEITTLGDRGAAVGDKSRWVSELERALLEGRIDVAVHSAKDVPTELPEGLELVAIPERAEARDVICGVATLAELAPGARVGTSSLRRAAQVRAARDDLDVREVRGNVDTRLRKLAGRRGRRPHPRRRGPGAPGSRRRGRGADRGFRPRRGTGRAGAGGPVGSDRRRAARRGLRPRGDGVRHRRARARQRPWRLLQHADRRACPGTGRRPSHAHGMGGPARRLGVAARRGHRRRRRGRHGLRRAHAGGGGRRATAPGGGGGARVTVYLVGAGPGDPGLLTSRALELIAGADVIVHDRLIPATALDGARADALLLYAGKEGGGPSASQEEIEALLLEHGAAGRDVVRLKGGDPFVFGRGGEEAERLRAAGIPFEIVPGVTAGVAASAYAGIPVTHRDAASAVAFVTGHEDPAKFGVGPTESALDWAALARFPGTLVVYMGVRRLEGDRARADGGRALRHRARRGHPARHPPRPACGHRDA